MGPRVVSCWGRCGCEGGNSALRRLAPTAGFLPKTELEAGVPGASPTGGRVAACSPLALAGPHTGAALQFTPRVGRRRTAGELCCPPVSSESPPPTDVHLVSLVGLCHTTTLLEGGWGSEGGIFSLDGGAGICLQSGREEGTATCGQLTASARDRLGAERCNDFASLWSPSWELAPDQAGELPTQLV